MGEGASTTISGGFHRYATDRDGGPHFEDAYDNAALAEILVDTYRLTSDPELERFPAAVDFVLRS
jgi:uncharacterized protein YyaL (SSP411 family)